MATTPLLVEATIHYPTYLERHVNSALKQAVLVQFLLTQPLAGVELRRGTMVPRTIAVVDAPVSRLPPWWWWCSPEQAQLT
jgi:hypothetical protein